MAKLSDPVTLLKGVGPTKAKQFAALNIYTLEDLICHFPRGYEDRTKLLPIEKLAVDTPACFKGYPITLIAAGLLALAFMGFSGMSIS